MREIGTEEVTEGLFELFKQKPVLMNSVLALNETNEEAAVALLLASARGQWEAWDRVSPSVAATARGLLMDFFLKVMNPRRGEMLGKHWRIRSSSLPEMALAVVAQEIERSHPGQAKPH